MEHKNEKSRILDPREEPMEEPFPIHVYRKQELAMMYFPYASKECAGRNLRRWIHHCKGLYPKLVAAGYDKNRRFYLSREVRLIIEYLGEP